MSIPLRHSDAESWLALQTVFDLRTAEIASAARELEGIDPQALRRKIVEHVRVLANEPHPSGSQKLTGSKNAYRARHGHDRVLYEVLKTERRSAVVKIDHRREVSR